MSLGLIIAHDTSVFTDGIPSGETLNNIIDLLRSAAEKASTIDVETSLVCLFHFGPFIYPDSPATESLNDFLSRDSGIYVNNFGQCKLGDAVRTISRVLDTMDGRDLCVIFLTQGLSTDMWKKDFDRLATRKDFHDAKRIVVRFDGLSDEATLDFLSGNGSPTNSGHIFSYKEQEALGHELTSFFSKALPPSSIEDAWNAGGKNDSAVESSASFADTMPEEVFF